MNRWYVRKPLRDKDDLETMYLNSFIQMYKADEVDADKAKDTARIQELEEQIRRLQRIIVIGGQASAEFRWRFAPEIAIATEALKEGEDG